MEVQELGEAGFTLLTPRQELSTAISPRQLSLVGGNGLSCSHNHFGENWVSANTLGFSVEDTTSQGVGIERIANTGPNSIGVLGKSINSKGVYSYSSSGISLYAGGSGKISSIANSVVYLSPHELLKRTP